MAKPEKKSPQLDPAPKQMEIKTKRQQSALEH